LVGGSFAKSLSLSLNIPLIEVNHMQAHILAHFIEDNCDIKTGFPFLGVNISGGHTQIVYCRNYFDMEIIGETLDDSIGEAFDKCGKMLGLKYPAGPKINKLANEGNENKFNFSKPKVDGLNFSFSGLKTNFKRFLEKNLKNDEFFVEKEINNLCASLQLTITEILFEKVKLAAKQKKILNIVFGGGVSANTKIRGIFKNENNLKLYFPKLEYTTDNAAMIAIVGYLKFKEKLFSELNLESKARYSI
jgi:N6-L-threonylcarbamoyladenine synthase